jgi:uncharacterized membrane protein YccC
MSLYRVMRAVGFEHGDIVGGLLPEDPAYRLDEKQRQLADKLRRLHIILVRHRRAIEGLRQRIEQNRNLNNNQDRDRARLRRHQLAYQHFLAMLAGLRQKQMSVLERRFSGAS